MRRRFCIAMVAPGPFPSPRGSQVLVRELAVALGALGHSVHVVAYGAGVGALDAPGVVVHRTPAILGGANAIGPHPWRIVLDFVLLFTLYRVVRNHRVDVIHAHNYEAPTLAYAIRSLLGVPVVYHAHNLMRDELSRYFRPRWSRRLATRAGLLLDQFVPSRADCVVALSQAVADDLQASGVAPERIEVIPPGIFSANQSSDRIRRDPYPGAKVIVYAGNLDPYQDLNTLVDAIAEVRQAEPTAKLVIATHGNQASGRRELRSMLATEGVELQVVDGFDAVQVLLQRADVVVCPRTSWSGFPIKLLNYMAAARPIVVSAGAARALGKGPWIVVADGNSSAFAKGILLALRNPTLQRRLGGAVRRRVEKEHDWSKLVPRVERIYGRVTRAALERC